MDCLVSIALSLQIKVQGRFCYISDKNRIAQSNFHVLGAVSGLTTAFLYVLLGVANVYAQIMSEGAVQVFQQYGITMELEFLKLYLNQ